MLQDQERKLLRILSNYLTVKRPVPSLGLLRLKTGREKEDIEISLKLLNDLGYIDWIPDRHFELKVLKNWEDGVFIETASQRRDTDPAFWMFESF